MSKENGYLEEQLKMLGIDIGSGDFVENSTNMVDLEAIMKEASGKMKEKSIEGLLWVWQPTSDVSDYSMPLVTFFFKAAIEQANFYVETLAKNSGEDA